MPNDEWVTTAATAELLGVSTSQVARLARSDALKPVAKAPGLRGGYFFRRSDVEALAAGGEATDGSTALTDEHPAQAIPA